MKWKISPLKSSSLFTVEAVGDSDKQSIITMLKELVEHPEWEPGKKILIDYKEVSIGKVDIGEIREIARVAKIIDKKFGPSVCAIVAPTIGSSNISMFYFEVTNSLNMTIRIFEQEKLEDAFLWLKNTG